MKNIVIALTFFFLLPLSTLAQDSDLKKLLKECLRNLIFTTAVIHIQDP